jgi:hypothetical protein
MPFGLQQPIVPRVFHGPATRPDQTLLQARQRPGTPTITWAGTRAEFTKTHSSIPSLNLRSLLAALRLHHLDVYQFMVRNVRLPIPGMGLKEVARYFGIERKSPIVDGIEANRIYAAFLQARGTDREKLRQELQQYNQDDLDCTAQVVLKLKRDLRSVPSRCALAGWVIPRQVASQVGRIRNLFGGFIKSWGSTCRAAAKWKMLIRPMLRSPLSQLLT